MQPLSSEKLDVPIGTFWFKVTGFLEQNWGMVVETKASDGNAACIYFFDDHGEVFDTLNYPNAAQADHALAFNEFTPLDDEPGFRAVAGEPRFPLTRSSWESRPVYSSGEYWKQAPDIAEITHRRILTPAGLQRFIKAQEPVMDVVIRELKSGKKRTHWMWFVFPQISGLGNSSMSRKYGIVNLDEAQAYLDHPLLGPRLRDCFAQVLKHSDHSAEAIFVHIDAKKFRSCATLFTIADDDEESVFSEALRVFFAGKKDSMTLELQ